MVARIVAGWVRAKRTGWPVLKALVYGKDHQLAGACERSMVQEAAQIGQYTRGFRAVPTKDFANTRSHALSYPREPALSCLGRAFSLVAQRFEQTDGGKKKQERSPNEEDPTVSLSLPPKICAPSDEPESHDSEHQACELDVGQD